ncbi:hypothetical protein QO034_22670 [Sedimentitalea sp. JM2-8]|uniref:Arginine transporter n=1 Tax=Sedimentitalea xiamensis TaxID=3050037 RepID=A0ABT7FL61_9RHOB|nr:hypothetical protein [Sedimentitalea xiamensis]MDK3075861.1 hypothetical protein [Sedimentitalea xiamensis]
MKRLCVGILCFATLAGAAPEPVQAATGIIEKACRSSGRSAATPQLCSCIEAVARESLTRSDRKKAAKFFRDPHMAQEVRQSDRRSDERFWKRYRAFGDRAALTCG